MTQVNTGGRTVILGVAESDAHAVANRLIAAQLRACGYRVVNLGVCTPLSDFADAQREHPQADAVIIGSVNGHACEDLRDLPALRACGRLAVPVIVGGNVSINAESRGTAEQELYRLGVDHVLADAAELLPVLAGLPTAAGRRPEVANV